MSAHRPALCCARYNQVCHFRAGDGKLTVYKNYEAKACRVAPGNIAFLIRNEKSLLNYNCRSRHLAY